MADKKFRNKKKKNKKNVLILVRDKIKSVFDNKNYIEAIGRRKTSIARVRMIPDVDKNEFFVNGKDISDFFNIQNLVVTAKEALEGLEEKYKISVLVKGGGISAQAEAIRLGIARALIKINPDLRFSLKSKGLLKRDPRSVERKKPGLKKARKAPTWVKR